MLRRFFCLKPLPAKLRSVLDVGDKVRAVSQYAPDTADFNKKGG
jgi:hypothetical protein